MSTNTEMNEDEAKALGNKLVEVTAAMKTSMEALVRVIPYNTSPWSEIIAFLIDVVKTKRALQKVLDATHRPELDKIDVNMTVVTAILEFLPEVLPVWARKKIDG